MHTTVYELCWAKTCDKNFVHGVQRFKAKPDQTHSCVECYVQVKNGKERGAEKIERCSFRGSHVEKCKKKIFF